MQLTTFIFKIIYPSKILFEFVTFENQTFQTTSYGDTTKTKLIDLVEIYKLAVHNFIFDIIYPFKIQFEVVTF